MRRSPLAAFALLLASCSAPPPPAPPPAPTPPPPPVTAAPAPPPAPPKLVIQHLGLAQSMAGRAIGRAASPGGALVASWGPELTVADGQSGEVRGRFPGCAIDAVFTPDGAGLVVLGCPRKPVEGPFDAKSPEVEVVLWDLEADALKPLAKGPFEHVAWSADHAALLLWGIHAGRVIGFADGKEIASFDVAAKAAKPFDRIERIGARGDRALALVGEQTVILRRGQPSIPLGKRGVNPGVLSADLRRRAVMDGDALKVVDLDSGAAVLEKALVKGCKPQALSTTGDRVAVSCPDPNGVVLAAYEASGRAICNLQPKLPKSTWIDAARFSVDGARIAVAFRGMSHPNDVAAGVYKAEGCVPEQGEPQTFWWHSSAWSDDLSAAVTEDRMYSLLGGALRVLRVKDERGVRAVPARQTDLLTRGPDGDPTLVGKDAEYVWDPIGQSFHKQALRGEWFPLRAGNRTLHVEPQEGGDPSPLARRMPASVPGRLLLVGDDGKKTILQRSEEAATKLNPWFGCHAGGKGLYLTCGWTDYEKWGVEVWEVKTGRRVVSRKGITGRVSADDTRVVVAAYAGENELEFTILDPKTDKSVASFKTVGVLGSAFEWCGQFGPAGALAALDGVGVVDGATGKLLWATKYGFPENAWTPKGDTIVVRREDRMWEPRGQSGRMEVRDVKTGALVTALDDDAEIVAYSPDGSLALTRDPMGIHRLREVGSWKVRASFGPAYEAFFTAGGDYVYAQGNGPLRVVRTADGEELFQVLPADVSKHGFSFTAGGLFDGDEGDLDGVKFRVGGVATGRLLGWKEARPEAKRDLIPAFFAGTPMPK